MSKALIELEKFSLLKWNRLTKTLLIHRLVQSMVKDEMSDTDSMTYRITIINLCDRSFPQEWSNKNRELCRIYVGQVMRPLLDIKVIRTEQSARIMDRVGSFLREDGKFNDSERLSLRASEISAEILGPEHPDTLTTMDSLASTYWLQGRTAEAAALQELVLEKRRRIQGDDHPAALATMGNLALSYGARGKTAEAAALQEQVLEKRGNIKGNPNDDQS
jgi:hypothetical protein